MEKSGGRGGEERRDTREGRRKEGKGREGKGRERERGKEREREGEGEGERGEEVAGERGGGREGVDLPSLGCKLTFRLLEVKQNSLKSLSTLNTPMYYN